MLTNYFFLFRQVSELNVLLAGSEIISCFSQEKDTLNIEFSTDNNTLHLEFRSTFPNPYLVIRKNFARARKNTVDFWDEVLPLKVKKVGLIENERIIKITLEQESSIILFIRGTKSNILFIKDGEKIPFRRDDEELSQEVVNSAYAGHDISDADSFIATLSELDFETHSHILGSEIRKELSNRTAVDSSADVKNTELRKIISGIVSGTICLLRDESSGKHHLLPQNFLSGSGMTLIQEFSSSLDATAEFIKIRYKNAGFHHKKKTLLGRLQAEIKILEKKLADTRKRISDGNNSEKYQKYAELLLYVDDKKQKGLTSIEVPDVHTDGSVVIIPLDAKLDINQNRRKYFDKVKKETISFQNSLEIEPELLKKISNFSELINKIENTTSLDELNLAAPDVPGQKKQEAAAPGSNFRKFSIHENFDVYVGKDSRQNDELTMKFAKPNDLWFHARGVPGSHTVLRDKTGRNEFPKEMIKKAAAIAAFFSKAKNAKYVPVAYSEKKHVSKRKGMEPGKVMMSRETIIMVEPGLPEENNSK